MVVFTVKALWKCFSSPNGSNMTWESSKSNLKVKRNESYDVQPNMRITYSDTVKKKNENVQYVLSIYLFVENKCIRMIQLIHNASRNECLCLLYFSVSSSDTMLWNLWILKQGWAYGYEQVR